MSRKSKNSTDGLVRIYVRPETAYHLNRMLAQSNSLKYPGQIVDKILRTIMAEEKEVKKRGEKYYDRSK